MTSRPDSHLVIGNRAFRENKFDIAVQEYLKAIQEAPALTKIIRPNLDLARSRYRKQREGLAKPRVGVCGWDLAHNAAGRVYTLAKMYEAFADVEIIGCLFPQHGTDLWEPIRRSALPAVHSFVVHDEDMFLTQAIALVSAHPYDVVHLSKPRMPNILVGMLYKLIWQAKVIVDVDDEELAFAGADEPQPLLEFLQTHVNLPALRELDGKFWTRIAVGMLKAFDGVTASSTMLQAKYGGELIPHARDGLRYAPSPELKRQSRNKFKIPQDKKVVLFFGTPRAHKGLVETSEAIASLKRRDVLFVVVGEFRDATLKSKLLERPDVDYLFMGNQPFDDIPSIVAMADCCVLLQDQDAAISRYQVPAKLTDALAMGVPVLASRVPPLSEYLDEGACVEVTLRNLASKLGALLDDRDAQAKVSQAARRLFERKYTTATVAKTLQKTLDNVAGRGDNLLATLVNHIGDPVLATLSADGAPGTETEVLAQKTVGAGEGDQHVRLVVPETAGHHPDLFRLRADPVHSATVAIAWVTSQHEVNAVQAMLSQAHEPLELILLAPASNAHALRFARNSNCPQLSVLAYPSQTTEASAFVRLMNGGVLTRYENVLWIDPRSSAVPADLAARMLRAFTAPGAHDVGILAERTQTLDQLRSTFVRQRLGTWLPRLHRSPPSGDTSAPWGSAMLRAVLLRQASALAINPSELEGIGGVDGANALRAVLAAFCQEGSYGLLSFTELDAQPAAVLSPAPVARRVKTIAFFLPQFHIIPENDSWWGKGFTEWNNVVRAKPLFRGHYQPRLPADLGFYDLRSPTTQAAQARLATEHGVHGFCYYYYWFNGRKLLNDPIEQMLNTGSPDFPFCVCWANENWSRNWDGQNRHVLMEQGYSLESNRALIQEFIKMMKDRRYIRHEGRPVLLVYRIKLIPNWLETAAMWRDECRRAGVGEIHLCSIRFGLEPLEGQPQDHGLDAYVLFPPQDTRFVDVRADVADLQGGFGGSLLSYDAVVDGDVGRFKGGYPWPVHRGAMLGWDNTARRLKDARIFVGCTPMRYRSWIKEILSQEEEFNKKDESLLFINAWNEWAEGTTLEPDQRYGKAYLEATKSVLARYATVPPLPAPAAEPQNPTRAALPTTPVVKAAQWLPGKAEFKAGASTILLCAHISGHQLFGGERSFLDVLAALSRLQVNIVVTLPSGNNKQYIEKVAEHSMGVYVLPYPQWVANRSADPMLTLIFSDIIAMHNVSVVYANTIVLIEPLNAAGRMQRVSVVHARELITMDDGLRERIGLPVQTIVRTVFDRTDFIVANSRATERVFHRNDRTYYVPNAVDARELDIGVGLHEKIRVGIVSSNIPKKGVADFIEVATRCADIAHLVDFIVVGPDNTQTAAWKNDVHEGRLPGNLKFLGYRETPKAAMSELDVLLNLSSFAESFGRTVAEAMAARRPVVAYEWGALPELVKHDETGFLAPFGDIDSVAHYVRRLCQDKALIAKMGNAAFKTVSTLFSHESLFRHLRVAIDGMRRSPRWKRLSGTAIRNQSRNDVTVVIPVYNAHDEVKACLESVVRHTPLSHVDVLIVNDGSSDPRIETLLADYRSVSGLRILSNQENIGYTKTVNRGIDESGTRDVILLNSDTIVTPHWLSGLRATAYAEAQIGTVTAMSDNAGAFSFPAQGRSNPKPDHLSHDEYAMRIVNATHDCRFVDVPTGSGFCMYIRRELLDQIGSFDEQRFPRGYGEENDFCMRALEAGWRNVITPWSFVYHVRTASFKGEKDALVQAGVGEVTKRFPDYAARVKLAFSSAEITELRARASSVEEQAAIV